MKERQKYEYQAEKKINDFKRSKTLRKESTNIKDIETEMEFDSCA